MDNLTTMFTDVNDKVGTIAGEVGRTPSSWNSGVFSMIENLSENVMIPIAGMIISAILCYELITMVMDKNNMHEVGSEFFFRYLIKACIAVLLLSYTFDITMAIFDVGNHIVTRAGGIVSGSTTIDVTDTLKTMFDSQIDTMGIGELIGLGIETMIVSLCMKIISLLITVMLFGRMIEIYLYISVAPVPFATFSNREWGGIGNNYIKGLCSLAFQGFFIMVCVAIYKEALKLKSDFIITLCDLIAGGKNGLENDEKGIIDECIRHIYDAYFENPVPENMPILEDLYNALLEHKNKKAERIANSLVLYVHGSQNYFNHRTNVDSQNRIMCFDIRDLGNQLKELGMLIVQDAVWNRVSQNRERKIATRYYCDEFHLLLKEKQTAIYSVEIWKRFRKWGGIPTGLTQNVGDFLKSEEIEGILGNSDFVYLLNQNAKDQAILADKLGLSEKQLAHVTNSEPGCGLILFDNVVIPFVDKYPVDTKTFAVMNTKPEESVRQEVNE